MEMYSDHSRPSTEHSEKGCMAVIRRENTRSTTSTTVTRACQVQKCFLVAAAQCKVNYHFAPIVQHVTAIGSIGPKRKL